MTFYREIEDIASALIKAKKDKINVNLLIGAGCSVTSKIPTAAGIVEVIKEEYPREYTHADPKDYSTCMSKLTSHERKSLIGGFVNNAKINMTHIVIAQLIKEGYINRVLTTNFDNLILRSCALIDVYPAVYDLASSKVFRPELLMEEKSVFHLHGQHTGFILCNTPQELKEQFDNLQDVFHHLKQKSLWIIIGYSGLNDSIFKLLSGEKSFEHRLFWVGYNNQQPPGHVVSEILDEKKYAFYVKSYDSDNFFVALSRRIGIFPPDFIKKPFSHLSNILGNVQQFRLPREETYFVLEDLKLSTNNIIKEAVQRIENDPVLMANHLLNLGLTNEFYDLLRTSTEVERSAIIEKYNVTLSGTVTELKSDCQEYRIKIHSNPDDLMTKRDLAITLKNMASITINKTEASTFLNESNELFAEIFESDKKNTRTLQDWADVIMDLANSTIEDSKRLSLYSSAIEKLRLALELDPENTNVLVDYINANYFLFDLQFSKRELDIDKTRSIQRICENALRKVPSDSRLIRLYASSLSNNSNHLEDDEMANEYIIQACEQLLLAHDISKLSVDFLEIGKCLTKLFVSESFKSITERVRTILDKFIEIAINEIEAIREYSKDSLVYQVIQPAISELNNVAFWLINKEEFRYSLRMLELYLSIDITDPYPFATYGYWYFRNAEVDVNYSWETGKKYYDESVKVASDTNHSDLIALRQKANYEFALFQYNKLNNPSAAHHFLMIAYEIGAVENFNWVYEEVQVLMEEISSYDFSNTEVASYIEPNDEKEGDEY